MQKRVLMISLGFYPCASIGTHRAGKFVKYLPSKGWLPTVLTIRENLCRYIHPFYDAKLLETLPSSVKIVRCGYLNSRMMKEFVLGLFSWLRPTRKESAPPRAHGTEEVPKKRKWGILNTALLHWIEVPLGIYWLFFALWPGWRIARKSDVIWATCPFPASLCLAAVLSVITRRPLVIDFRDPWSPPVKELTPTFLHAWVRRAWERFVMWRASCVVVVSDHMAVSLKEEFPQYVSKIKVIYNGYDRDDLDPKLVGSNREASQEIKLGYFGVLSYGRWDYMRMLLNTLQNQRSSSACGRIRLVYRGPESSQLADLCKEMGLEDVVDIAGVMPYREALRLMSEMDLLLLLGSSIFAYALPGKVFEYIGAGKPILAIAPESTLVDFVRRHGVGGVAVSEDAVAETLESMVNNFQQYQENLKCASERFTREYATDELVSIMNRIGAR